MQRGVASALFAGGPKRRVDGTAIQRRRWFDHGLCGLILVNRPDVFTPGVT
jgi:hypothetical protein